MDKPARDIAVGDVLVLDPAKYGPGVTARVLEVSYPSPDRVTFRYQPLYRGSAENQPKPSKITYARNTVLRLSGAVRGAAAAAAASPVRIRVSGALAPQIKQVIDLHRKQLFGLIEVRGVKRLQDLYAQAQGNLQERLADLVRRGRGDTFSAHHLRLVLAQVSQGVAGVQQKMGEHLAQQGKVAAKLAPAHVLDAAEKLHAGFGSPTPLVSPDQAGVFQGLSRSVTPSLLDRFEVSRRYYGPPVIAKVRDELSLALLRKESLDAAVDQVAGVDGIFSGQRYRAERIVRTELSWAYGVAKQKGMEVLKERFVPKLMKRLVATHDDRTGEDSVELDGQTVPVDQPFVWHVKNSKGVVLRTVLYMQPPNRPNDREVVIPWEAGWPSPGEAGAVDPSVGGLPG